MMRPPVGAAPDPTGRAPAERRELLGQAQAFGSSQRATSVWSDIGLFVVDNTRVLPVDFLTTEQQQRYGRLVVGSGWLYMPDVADRIVSSPREGIFGDDLEFAPADWREASPARGTAHHQSARCAVRFALGRSARCTPPATLPPERCAMRDDTVVGQYPRLP
jgi:hypothetical protein